MPEAPEVETDKLHEMVHETLEREGGAFLKMIAFSTALLAALAAVASLEAGATANEALVLKADATRHQAEASDQWAYYQAKGIKAAVQEASRTAWLAAGKAAPAEFEQASQRYAREQADIMKEAQARERERDEKSREADQLLLRHHRYSMAVALFQIAIALGAVAALTRVRLIWFGSMATGAVAVVILAQQLIR